MGRKIYCAFQREKKIVPVLSLLLGPSSSVQLDFIDGPSGEERRGPDTVQLFIVII